MSFFKNIKNQHDIAWVLSLFGTALGAGTLYLPIRLGIDGFWLILFFAIAIGPIIWLSHKGLARYVLSNNSSDTDIINTTRRYFSWPFVNVIAIGYFLAIYPMLLIYSVSLTNTVEYFAIYQLHYHQIPRWIVSGILVIALTGAVVFSKKIMLIVNYLLVYPLIIILFGISLYLIPHWHLAILDQHFSWTKLPHNFMLDLSMLIYAFTFNAVISTFANAQRVRYKKDAIRKSDKLIVISTLLLTFFIMFFVFSCVLSLNYQDLKTAQRANITILSYLANIYHSPIIRILGPVVAFIGIATGYFGAFLGANEGLKGFIVHNFPIFKTKIASIFSISTIMITVWLAGIYNININILINYISSPAIVVTTFLLPVYAMNIVSKVRNVRISTLGQIIVGICGILILINIFF